MWKCNEWWKIQLTLGIWCGPLSQHAVPPARHQPHLMIPSAQTINPKKAKNPEMRFNSYKIIQTLMMTKKGTKEHNPNWSQIPDHSYRILMIRGSGSGKTNWLSNVISLQASIDKVYLYAKDRY